MGVGLHWQDDLFLREQHTLVQASSFSAAAAVSMSKHVGTFLNGTASST